MKCSRPTCDRPVNSVGMCGGHYMKALRLGILGTGRQVRVDAAPLVEHIAKLRALDWTWPMIADAASVSISVVHGYYTRPDRPAAKSTVEAVLAVPLVRAFPHNKLTDSTGTRRRVEALELLGWPRMVIEQRIGVAYLSLSQALSRDKVTVRMARLVEDFYLRNNNSEGPSPTVAKRSRNRGYLPAIVWEDDTIDNPAAQPNLTGFDELTVQALMDGERVPTATEIDRVEATIRLTEAGLLPHEIGRLMGCRFDTVLERLGKEAA